MKQTNKKIKLLRLSCLCLLVSSSQSTSLSSASCSSPSSFLFATFLYLEYLTTTITTKIDLSIRMNARKTHVQFIPRVITLKAENATTTKMYNHLSKTSFFFSFLLLQMSLDLCLDCLNVIINDLTSHLSILN